MRVVVLETDNEIPDVTVARNLRRILNQVYRLLPVREEGGDWKKPLSTILIELTGMLDILPDLEEGLALLSKLDAMLVMDEDLRFGEYRRAVFECCSILGKLADKAGGGTCL